MIKRLSKVVDTTNKNYRLTYFNYLSATAGGFNEGEVITIAARVGCGKTTLALNILAELSMKGRCLFLSLEMGAKEILTRLRKSGLRFNADNILLVENDDTRTLEELIRIAKPRFLFIDYIQLMDGSIKQNTRMVKQLTLKYNLITFQMSQLNRLAATETPKLEMLSTSDKIAHDSDQVWLITGKYVEIAKNRKGRTDKVAIKFIKEQFLFEELGWYNEPLPQIDKKEKEYNKAKYIASLIAWKKWKF